MKTIPSRKSSKKLARIIAAIVAGSFTLSGMAWAASSSTSPFPNVPLGTNLSVAPNLIFLQDDSGSMQWDWIGDGGTYLQQIQPNYGFPLGTPNVFNVDFNNGYSNTYGDNIPSFSSQDVLAGQYRSTQINPIYYNPAITYLPWACAVPASEENSNTSPAPTMTNGDGQTITCQWNSQVNLWLMPDANPQKVYLNPWFPNRGWRDFEAWNDSTNPASTTTTNGGFSGTGSGNRYNGTKWWYVSSSGQIQSYGGQYINNFFTQNTCASEYSNCMNYGGYGYGYCSTFESNSSCQNATDLVNQTNNCYNSSNCNSFFSTYCTTSTCQNYWRYGSSWQKQYLYYSNVGIVNGFWPAVYFNYTSSTSGNSKTSDENNIANYQKVEICPTSAPTIPLQSSLSGYGNTNVSSTLPACNYPTVPSNTSAYPYTYYENGNYIYVTGPNQTITRSYTQEIQNYANWYQYARNHIFLARDGISQAFMSLPSGFRVDYATINQITSNGTNYSGVPFYDNGNSGGAANSQAIGSSQANAPYGSTVGTLQHFGAAQRQWFLSTFFGYQTPEQGTPSRQALTAIGNWLMQPAKVNAAPWGASAGATADSPRDNILTCRQNFTVFVTDGGWNNDSSVSTLNNSPINNPDQEKGTTITGANGQSYTYTPTPPFMDQPGNAPTGSGGTACNGKGNCNGSLANIAFWYWEHPLQHFGTSSSSPYSSSSYDVPTSPSDPAFWPHMDTFTVGLGVSGYLNYPSDLAQLQAGSLAWSDPYPSKGGNNPALIDDLWHAGINGHGNYYSASNPTELSSGLTSALQTIEARTLSNSSVAVTGAQLSTSSLAFVPSYNTGNWTGDVQSFLYNPGTNTFNTNYNWSAQSNISAQQKSAEQDMGINSSSAHVYTFNGSTGIPFSSSSLSSAQQSELMNSAFIPSTAHINQVVDNILGNTSEDGSLFRNRNGKVLGDIIDATPQYVGAPNQNYTFPGYGSFANANAKRIPVLYVPANDGMLHAIDACATSYPSGVTPPAGCSGSGGASAGKELWAYIPNAVIPYLDQRISASAFSHQYLMDSTPTTGAFCTAGTGTGNTGTCTTWESLLVASEGRGVSGIYGLNITNPNPSSASALDPWEITPSTTGFSDMGYIIASPQLIKTQSMGWVVVFGSGYQPTPTNSGDGYIYFVNPNNGALLTTVTLPNQVSGSQLSVAGIAPASFNAPGYAQALYVTDNEGDLWKIDLPANSSPPEGTQQPSALPTIGYGRGPMFVAKIGTGSTAVRQPISTAPVVSMDAQGRIGVIFGTGQWLFSSDTTDNQTQNLYGIWDVNQNNTSKRTTPIPESDLVQQTLTKTTGTASTGGTAYNTRTGSSNPVPYSSAPGGKKGWYINLPISGERLIDNPQIVFGDAIFTSFVPGATSTNPCQSSGSGTSWITAVNFNTGAVPSTNPFGFTGSNITVNSIQVAGQAPQPTVTSTATGMKLLLPGVNGGSPNAVPFFPPFNAGAATRAWTNR